MTAGLERALLLGIRRGQARAREGIPPPPASESWTFEGIKSDSERTPEDRRNALNAMRRLFGMLLDRLEEQGTPPQKITALTMMVEQSLAATEIAQNHAGERADELSIRAGIAVEYLKAEPHAGRMLKLASELPPNTFNRATAMDLLIAAVLERSEGQHYALKPGERERAAVRRIAEAWTDCTGKKATASFDSKDGMLRQTPFVVFLRCVLNFREMTISDRQVREALRSKTAQKKESFLAGPRP